MKTGRKTAFIIKSVRITAILLAAVLAIAYVWFYLFDHSRKTAYDYENKELWYNSIGLGKGVLSDILRFGGSISLGWNFGDYINSPAGEWAISQYRLVYEGYEETDPEVYAWWESRGITKTLYHEQGDGIKYSVFTANDTLSRNDGTVCPVMFVMHGGNQTIYTAEWYGFVEEGVSRGYIVIIPEWEKLTLSSDDKAALAKSGLPSWEAYSTFQVIEEIQALGYPADLNRMYLAGYSGGGNAAAYAAAGLAEYFAAFSPSTGAAVQGSGVSMGEDERSLYEQLSGIRDAGGMGMMMIYGLKDVEQRWPITTTLHEMNSKAKKLSVEERTENVYTWLSACGYDAAEKTPEEAFKENSASGFFGISFDKEYSRDYESTYYFGDDYNEDGRLIVRFMGIADNPHFVSMHWAQEFYDFCENFSRDPITHQLIVS